MSAQLKQKYLLANSPSPPNFDEERTKQFEKLLVLISTTERARWLSTGFNCGPLIESYKQVYGLTSEQFETLLMLLINIAFNEQGLSTDVRAYLLRLLNTMSQFQIKITDNFSISNKKLLMYLQELAREGMQGALKHSDAVIEDLSKFILYFSRFGEDVVEEALEMAIETNDIRYLVIFLRSIKSEKAALRLLTELFSDNNLWDRDCSWFYILGEIIKKFPKLDYSLYYQTIMQEVIRAFTTIINGDNEEAVKKLTSSEAYLHIQPVLKSAALIMTFLMLPETEPQHIFIKSCNERLFSLIISSLDYVNPPDYLDYLMVFAKAFVRYYLLRFRGERGLFKLYNEDIITDLHEPNDQNLMIDQDVQDFFDALWVDIIPKIVFLQDPEECKPSKIIAELCMYKPQKFLKLSLDSVLNVVNRDDPTLVSFHGAKITILFLQEYVILDQPQYLSSFIDCTMKMMGHLQRLGVADNLDIIQLFCRNFIYISEDQLNEYYIQSAVNDTLVMLLENLQSMSIGLQDAEDQQAELYLDFANIFLPFFLRVDPSQLQSFSEKFIYRLLNSIPEHTGAYEMIMISLTLIDDTFTDKIFKHLLEKMVTFENIKGQEEVVVEWQFLNPVEGNLHVSNEQVLKWYSTILQCIFQYHPQNVVKYWNSIETILVVLLKEWENQTYLQIALDILYNITLCLCKPHLPAKQFSKKNNGDYHTLSLSFSPLSPEAKAVIDHIYTRFYLDIKTYLESIYAKSLESSTSDHTILADFDNYYEQNQNNDIIRIRKRNLKLVDYVIMPDLNTPEDAYDKKIIYRALSLQYTVLSALMFRVPFHSNLQNIGDFLIGPQYINLRPEACKYLQWILQLLGRFNLMGEEACVKLFNFFWRESHDEVCFTTAIQATNQKISPYFYPQLHRKKQLLRSPFLIANQAYLTHMARMEFHLMIAPTAHLNNSRYLQSNFILGLNPSYEPNLHSYFPSYVEVHQYHRELIAISRYHLNPNNPDSYLSKYLKEQDPATKERYNTAIRYLLLSFKRLLNIFSDACCMRDEFVRNTIFDTISLYKLLPKKNQKSLVYELIYVLLVFSFDPNCCQSTEQYSLKTFWQLKLEDKQEVNAYQTARINKTVDITHILEGIEEEQMFVLSQIDQNRGLKLTRSCSCHNDDDIQKQLERAISNLLIKIEEHLPNLQKDFNVYLLMLLVYSNCLHLKDPLISKITILLSKLCQTTYSEVFEMSKTGFFHMVNRFNYHQRKKIEVPNTPVRRPWEQFLRFKYIGSNQADYKYIKMQKNEQNFYPSKNLLLYQYHSLASDPASETYQNEKTLLLILQDQEGMFQFLKNCSLDPELKQTDQAGFSLVVSEENFKSVSAGAHKLMHFIWDSNPTKTPLFMGLLERYSASPLNFYNRLFRKIIRIGSSRTSDICMGLTQKLRNSDEPEMIRLSFYISCELMIKDPRSPIHQSFLDYLGQCTKQNFDYVLMGFYGIFTSNFVNAENSYNVVLQKLRSLKGAPRLRHLELSNTYMIAQGRFARKAAIQMSSLILKGIEEGGDEISEAIVSMITQCFVQAVNLKSLEQWVEEPLEELKKAEKIFILNEHVGYNCQNFLIVLLSELMKRAREQEQEVESFKLRIYSQIVKKILASITIYRFNEYFYKLLKEIIIYVMERPQSVADDDSADIFVITQLCDSEYPQEIYKDLLEQLLLMSDRSPYVIKKKLLFLQGMVINRSFRLNKLNEKQLTLDYILAIATILRLLKSSELTAQAERLLNIKEHRKKHQTYTLISILMATGSREFEWKQAILRDLIKHKKDKLVKESISEWWKGKTPQSDQEQRISTLVRNFQNPYNYFA